MRTQKQAKQSAAESVLATEGPDPAATAQAQAVGRTGSPMQLVRVLLRTVASHHVCTLLIANSFCRPRPSMGSWKLTTLRAVWSYVEGLDLTPLYDRVRASRQIAGRPSIDPRLLVALWLYATLSGFSGVANSPICAPITMPSVGWPVAYRSTTTLWLISTPTNLSSSRNCSNSLWNGCAVATLSTRRLVRRTRRSRISRSCGHCRT